MCVAHAGKLRDVDLTKKEWVLNGDTVQYEISCGGRWWVLFVLDRDTNELTGYHWANWL